MQSDITYLYSISKSEISSSSHFSANAHEKKEILGVGI